MKTPGGALLEHMLTSAGEDGLGMIGSLSMEDTAGITLATMDEISVAKRGTKVQPSEVRLLAEQAEQLATIYRRIANERDREMS